MSKRKRRLSRPKHASEVLRHLPPGYVIRYPDTDSDGTTNHRRAKSPKHPYLYDPEDELCRHRDGRPFQVASTPSDRRNATQTLAAMKRAGLPVID